MDSLSLVGFSLLALTLLLDNGFDSMICEALFLNLIASSKKMVLYYSDVKAVLSIS